VKRAYDPPTADDGYRVLVDGIWPRGLTKQTLRIDEWLKDVAPSAALRRWFGHDPARWAAFTARYFDELDSRPEAVAALRARLRRGPLTLVFAARDVHRNNAVALQSYLESRSGRQRETAARQQARGSK
jgi:uncharacterized protein YeaO (DUF488 family)